ncbi:hypothetical protein J6590_017178 [Homalodisca vitripennis]|nr:hypothetical protein J6590_017178 [Homalodisca vitripennis]
MYIWNAARPTRRRPSNCGTGEREQLPIVDSGLTFHSPEPSTTPRILCGCYRKSYAESNPTPNALQSCSCTPSTAQRRFAWENRKAIGYSQLDMAFLEFRRSPPPPPTDASTETDSRC